MGFGKRFELGGGLGRVLVLGGLYGGFSKRFELCGGRGRVPVLGGLPGSSPDLRVGPGPGGALELGPRRIGGRGG